MTTSLAEQLKRLAIPQTKVLTDSKKRVSLLFDPLEAAKLSRDAVHDIGCTGLNDLIKIDPNFENFRHTLFENESKYVQRAVETKEVNKRLNKQIDKFLIQLSPYLLLKSAHQALEWLIVRYQIHDLNVKALFALILPYHEANIFVRVLQLMDLQTLAMKPWSWLEPLQKNGMHLPKSVLINHAISDTSFLRFICKLTEKALKVHEKANSENKLRTLFGFFASTIVGILGQGKTNDHVLTVLLPTLFAGLQSTVEDFKCAAYMAVGQLLVNNQLEESLISKLLEFFIQEKAEHMRKKQISLLLTLFQRQLPTPKLSFAKLRNWDWSVPILTEFGNQNFLVGPLTHAMIEACLEEILENHRDSNDGEAQVLCWSLAEQVLVDGTTAAQILKLLVNHLERCSSTSAKKLKTDDEPNPDAVNWLQVMIEKFSAKYADAFDKIQDPELQNFRRLYGGEIFDEKVHQQIKALVRKCSGPGHKAAWALLKPILWKQIDDHRAFKAWLKGSPADEPLTLILLLDRLLRPGSTPEIKKLLVPKVAKSQFGQKSSFVTCLQRIFETNSELPIPECINQAISTSGYSPTVGQWVSVMNEMREAGKIGWKNSVWLYVFKILIPLISVDAVCPEIVKVLEFISLLRVKHQAILIPELVNQIKTKIPYSDFSTFDYSVCLRIKTLEICFKAYHAPSRCTETFVTALDEFVQLCFPDVRAAVTFLNFVAGGLPFASQNASLIPQLLQIHTLHYLWTRLKRKTGPFYEAWISATDVHFSVCCLLLALTSPSQSVRKAAAQVLLTISKEKDGPFCTLLKELADRRNEIIADADHVSSAFYCLLSPEETVQEVIDETLRHCLEKDRENLISVINSSQTPFYVATQICIFLEHVTSTKIMKDLTVFAQRALKTTHDAMIAHAGLTSYWHRLTTENIECLNDPNVWQLVQDCLRLNSSEVFSPAVAFVKVLNKELFAAMTVKKQEELLHLLVRVRVESGNPSVSTAISSVCRKIALDACIVVNLLNNMTKILPVDRSTEPHCVLELPEWRQGISLLELIQNKKKLNNAENLIQPLLTILKFCLHQEEQTAYEYAKQLCLGLLLHICQRQGTSNVDATALDVELVVQCLRASPNPQTHHHALLLLSCLSFIIPDKVMHNVMAIFTFMGSSLTRLDDEHSVQVVLKVVEAIVPVLVQKKTESADGDRAVAEVLRIFVWTLRDVPQHRRAPLFGRLLATLEPDRACWTFLLLLFENNVVSGIKEDRGSGTSMPAILQLGLELVMSFGPRVVLRATLKLIQYWIQIPMERMNPPIGVKIITDDYNPNGLFDIDKHSPKQLRNFVLTLATFLNSMLADSNLLHQVRELDTAESSDMEGVFKDAIAALLLYAPLCAAQQQMQPSKFWKALERLANDALDKIGSLITSKTLVVVITKLIQSEDFLRRKAVDLLNSHIQSHRGGFSAEEKICLEEAVLPILDIAVTPSGNDVIRQTALLSLRLLAKVLAAENMKLFKTVLIDVCKLCKTKGHLLASATLTVADIVAQLKVHALSELPKYLPPILKALATFITSERNDIVLMSLCAALYRIIEVQVAFLTPYLDQIMYVVSCVATRWPEIADLNRKILQIRQKMSANVPHRFLIPALERVSKRIIEESKLKAIGPLLSLLADSFASCSDVSKLAKDLIPFYLQILEIRSDAADGKIEVSQDDVLSTEEFAIDAILPFVLKLSEMSFKPLYYQIFHWASEHPHRSITFYRLSCKISDRFKGLFALFAGIFLQNAADLLDANNVTKTEKRYFGDGDEGEEKAILLVESIIQTLYNLFLFDSTTFLNKEKFQIIVQPLVNQLDNPLGGPEKLEERSKRLLTPCLAQMALSTDDTQWKVLNYQLLDKTRSPSPLVRIAALRTVAEMASKLGEDYLPLLPETIGPLAELFEDEDERVEEAMKEALRRMEDDLGEPIREYFH